MEVYENKINFTIPWEYTDVMNVVSYVIWQLEEHHKLVYSCLGLMFVFFLIMDALTPRVRRLAMNESVRSIAKTSSAGNFISVKKRLFSSSNYYHYTFTYTYIHTTHAGFPKGYQKRHRYFSETPMFYKNYLALRNSADVTSGKPIAV
jgi:hypothetical protein